MTITPIIPVPYPPMFSVPSMEKLALAMEEAVATVMHMHTAHAEATEELTLIKYQLTASKAKLLVEGVEGQGEVQMRSSLVDPHEALHTAELMAQRTHLKLELAKLQLDGLHYHLRFAEVSVRLANGSHLA